MGKSVFIGGGVSGILSIFPLLNLLNLFFMLWIVAGSVLTVHLLCKENKPLRRGDAILAGALSGLLGGAMFAFFSLVTVMGISAERLEALLDRAKAMAPLLASDVSQTLASGQFRVIMLLTIGLFVLLAIVAGAIAGWVARTLFSRQPGNADG
jgi:hypothetical protein